MLRHSRTSCPGVTEQLMLMKVCTSTVEFVRTSTDPRLKLAGGVTVHVCACAWSIQPSGEQ